MQGRENHLIKVEQEVGKGKQSRRKRKEEEVDCYAGYIYSLAGLLDR